MAETPSYTKKAIRNYQNKFDNISLRLPKGTKEIIKRLTGQSCNAYISELVEQDLKNKYQATKNINTKVALEEPETDQPPF